MSNARWYELGRFRILAKPLPTNECWTTHHVYLEAELVGRQLSAPSLDDCENRLKEHRRQQEPASTFKPYSVPCARPDGRTAKNGMPKRRVGRPRKEVSEQELLEALTS